MTNKIKQIAYTWTETIVAIGILLFVGIGLGAYYLWRPLWYIFIGIFITWFIYHSIQCDRRHQKKYKIDEVGSIPPYKDKKPC